MLHIETNDYELKIAQLDGKTNETDPEKTQVQDVMTFPVACAAPHTPYAELCTGMRKKKIRHLPVVEDDKVIGMVSIGDLNRAAHDEQQQTIRYLQQFMSVS